MGSDHHNLSCTNVGGDRHLHVWNDRTRDKEAIIAENITAPITDPVAVWQQFCMAFRLEHHGVMMPPPFQADVFIGGS